MISMQQQAVLNQTAEPEQSREDVQLTELQPVKQSRIKESTIKDAVTDALRVLHRFSEDCDDDRFGLQEFNFSKTTDKFERPSNKYRRTKVRRKQAGELKKNPADSDKETNDDDDEAREKNSTKALRSRKRRHDEEENGYKKRERSTAKDTTDDDEIEFDEDDEDEDLDKAEALQDEVYVYRQEPGSNSELEESEVTEEVQRKKDGSKNASVGRKKYLSGSKIKEKRERRSNSVDRVVEKKELGENCGNNNVDSTIESKVAGTREKDESSTAPSAAPNATTEEDVKNTKCHCNPEMDELQKLIEEEEADDDYDGSILDKTFCCLVCDARFRGTSGLRNHYKVIHTAGPQFKCNDCGKEFPLKERLKLHLRTHTGFRPYKCSDCDKSFARGSQLLQHRRTHSQERPYRCNLCSNTFTCSANLVLHIKRHKGQKDHKCHLCGRAFVRRDALRKHLECLHRDVKSFLCAICNKTFKGHLPQHMRTHMRDRPHRCGTCGQQFAQKSQLTVHQRTHSGQRPFRCLVCWQAFAHSTALKLHTRRHTGERPFTCSECKAGFTQLPHWKKHMKSIHGKDDPYGCKRCKSFFRMKSELDRHERTCHPNSDSDDDRSLASRSIDNSELPTIVEKNSVTAKHKLMTVERMRLLLAVLLKRISKQKRLDELGFGRRLIDDVLQDSLVAAGKKPVKGDGRSVLETLTRNLETFLEWTMPKEHWKKFRRMKKTPQEILEALTST